MPAPTEGERLRASTAPLFRDEYHAVAVGRRCLPPPASAAQTLARVRALLVADGAPYVCAHERLARQRRAEFSSGTTAIVNGWLLARCETDVCVALALSAHH